VDFSVASQQVDCFAVVQQAAAGSVLAAEKANAESMFMVGVLPSLV
jgi:hypothetical protein